MLATSTREFGLAANKASIQARNLVANCAGVVVAIVGLIIYGVKVSALRVPGEKATDVTVVLYAVPGALIGIAVIYLEGMRRERAQAQQAPISE